MSISFLSRRRLLAMAATGAASVALQGCVDARDRAPPPMPDFAPPPVTSSGIRDPLLMYAAAEDDGHKIPAIPIKRMNPKYYRQIVPDPTGEPPGTVVVDTANHFVYLVVHSGAAMRYGVGLGRAGFEWSGRGVIEWKQKWPRWFPPGEMIDRQPELEKYRAKQIAGTNEWEGGMEAGVSNPLGARALYIYKDGKDTLYRLHGSPEWASIGKSVSSGCVRFMNQDIIDLYDRVPDGAPIVVTGDLPMV